MNIFRTMLPRFAVLAAGLGLFVSGCSTDLDPNADYKETMVIYSVLNPRETVHYAKVTKAFLNTGTNAYTIAANSPDSTDYKKGDLEVFLEKLNLKDSSIVFRYKMNYIDTTGKEAGTFFSGRQILYRVNAQLDDDEDFVYRIKAHNTKTGNTASGATAIVQQGPSNFANSFCVFSISNSTPQTPVICFSETADSPYKPHEKKNVVTFRAPKNASIFTIKSQFYYTEIANGATTDKMVEWYEANNFIYESVNNETKRVDLPDFSFYTNAQKLIGPAPAGTTRETKYVLFKITAGSEPLRKNFQANNSYSVFSQTRPQYDNITNGTGLVASRITRTVNGNFTPEAVLKLTKEYPSLNFTK